MTKKPPDQQPDLTVVPGAAASPPPRPHLLESQLAARVADALTTGRAASAAEQAHVERLRYALLQAQAQRRAAMADLLLAGLLWGSVGFGIGSVVWGLVAIRRSRREVPHVASR